MLSRNTYYTEKPAISSGIRTLLFRQVDVEALRLPGNTPFMITRYRVRPGMIELSEHTHAFAQLCFIEQGDCIHRLNGIDRQLTEGHLEFILPQDIHGFFSLGKKEFVIVFVSFPAAVLDHLGKQYFDNTRSFFSTASAGAIHLSALQTSSFRIYLSELTRAPLTAIFRDRFLLEVLGMVTTGSTTSAPSPDLLPPWLYAACHSMKSPENLVDGTSRFLALCGKNKSHVAREVKRYFRLTPSQLITALRIEHAAALLLSSDKKITTIAEECGFSGLSFFYEAFKHRYGIPPNTYRKQRNQKLR